MQTIRDYEDVCHEVAAGKHDTATLQRMSDLQHELEEGGGWEIETNARSVLTKLDITDTSAKMGTGQVIIFFKENRELEALEKRISETRNVSPK
jgi:ATPase subunit of ABC transporter with duplicated ATPase domains